MLMITNLTGTCHFTFGDVKQIKLEWKSPTIALTECNVYMHSSKTSWQCQYAMEVVFIVAFSTYFSLPRPLPWQDS